MKTIVGTPYYLAPEVFEGQYNKECDCWSLGVICYILLFKQIPFSGDSLAEVSLKIKEGVLTWHEESDVSDKAKDFISRLLNVDKQKRLTCQQALEHEWITQFLSSNENGEDVEMEDEALFALCNYKCDSELK